MNNYTIQEIENVLKYLGRSKRLMIRKYLWTAIVIATLSVGFSFILNRLGDILWVLTTPIVELIKNL